MHKEGSPCLQKEREEQKRNCEMQESRKKNQLKLLRKISAHAGSPPVTPQMPLPAQFNCAKRDGVK
jgi:hypothetical protein